MLDFQNSNPENQTAKVTEPHPLRLESNGVLSLICEERSVSSSSVLFRLNTNLLFVFMGFVELVLLLSNEVLLMRPFI